jgi:hypothetical protein
VQQLRLKSTIQLEEYRKKRHQLQSLQRTLDENEDDNDRALLNTQLQTVRKKQLPARQEPFVIVPPCFTPQANAITPFAHPMVLNVFIAMNAVIGHSNNMITLQRPMTAPFRMQLPNLPTAPPERPVRKLLRSKMYCSTCGWRKKEHTPEEGRGEQPDHCSCQYCGNCYQLKEYHTNSGIPFGVKCTNPTKQQLLL